MQERQGKREMRKNRIKNGEMEGRKTDNLKEQKRRGEKGRNGRKEENMK